MLVSMLELLCIFAPDSLHHPFGNRRGNWGICQRRDKKVVINSSCRKLSFLIVLQIQRNGPFLRTITMQINQVMTLAICAPSILLSHLTAWLQSGMHTHKCIYTDAGREGGHPVIRDIF